MCMCFGIRHFGATGADTVDRCILLNLAPELAHDLVNHLMGFEMGWGTASKSLSIRHYLV
jgi:hypothetical protein